MAVYTRSIWQVLQVSQISVAARNEQGFVLIMALLMLVVLSIMSAAALSVRNTEVSIASNGEIIQHNFYALEAVSLEGTAAIEATNNASLISYNDVDWSVPTELSWLQRNDPDQPVANLIDLSKGVTWSGDKITPQKTSLGLPESADPADPDQFSIVPPGYDGSQDRIQYAAVLGNLYSSTNQYAICKGSDLSDPGKQENCYNVFGLYDVKSGPGKAYSGYRMLMVGYKKTVYLNP